MSSSVPPDYFDNIYATNPDPWNFAHSEYEVEKYARTLATLERLSYNSALEIGCSIGIMTQMLAQRCRRLLAIDVSETALAQARERNAGVNHVTFELRAAPHDLPEGRFDLMVLSEVAYYWTMPDLQQTAHYIQAHTEPEGQLLLVHWLPFEPDHPVTADQVHEFFLAQPGWHCVSSYRAEKYRIELLQRDGFKPSQSRREA